MNKAETSQSPAVAMSHLRVARGGATILPEVSASIGQGARVVLKGPSGSGKSTLLQAIIGFVPFTGELSLFGQPVSDKTIESLRGRIAYVGQGAALGQGRVKAYIREILEARANRHLAQPYQQLEAHFQQLHLPGRIWEQATTELSGGEQQRVLLALAMTLNRELYLLDEPTAALDAELQQTVIHWLNTATQATFLVAAHDESWAAAGWQTLSMPAAHE
jgi:ABC-type transport system involved in cytochrome bd biosynthesis fused ATPase/permease subunit